MLQVSLISNHLFYVPYILQLQKDDWARCQLWSNRAKLKGAAQLGRAATSSNAACYVKSNAAATRNNG